MDWLEWGYMGLFIASFLSATVVPFSSEAVLAGILLKGGDPILSIGIATLGNTLGGMTSFWIGHLAKWEWIERYLRVSKEKVMEWQPRIARYGSFFAVLSFVPFIGDAIPLALGFFRSNVWLTCFWMALGKFLRYMVIFGGVNLF
jgi:membrane protein YqaA with SNARE-associated domain